MGFIKKLKGLANAIPYSRRPTSQSFYEQFVSEMGWALQSRDKTTGVGWDTYFTAMDNVWVDACISAFVDKAINVGFFINNPDEHKVQNENVNFLTGLFEDPMGLNADDTFASFQSLTWRSMLGLGDTFIECITDQTFTNIPIGFKFIPTEYMKWYKDTSQWGFTRGDKRFEPEELIHIGEPSVRGGQWYESKIDKVAGDVTLDLLGWDYTREILEKKGLDPKGILSFSENLDKETWNSELERLKKQAKTNPRGTLMLKGGTYQRASLTNQDLQFQEMLDKIRDRILGAFRVPPSMVSIIETGNLGTGTGESQDKMFKEVFEGKTKLFEGAFRKVLGRGGFKETFHYKDIDIEDKLKRAQIEDIRLKNGSATINEVRNGYGEEGVDWGKEPFTNNSLNLLSLSDPNTLSNQLIPDVQRDLNKTKEYLYNTGMIKEVDAYV